LWNLSGSTINYTAGNVGIGTIPSYGLDVRSTGAPAIRLSRSGSAGQIASMVFEDGESTLGTGNTTRIASDSGAMSFSTGGTSGAITGGTERMRIFSGGNMAIGSDTVNTYRLNVLNTSTTAFDGLQVAGDNASYNLILQSGSVSAPGTLFGVNKARNQFITSNNSAITLGPLDAFPLVFGTNLTERMRILSDGSILLGTSTQGGATGISFSSASDSALYGKSMYMNSPYNGTRNAISFAYNSAGGVGQIVTGTNSVSYQSGSDYRLKKDIAPMTGALATVAQLKPVTFKWKSDSSNGQGFIAHEIQAIVPDCATGEKDAVDAEGKPVYQGVDTSFLVATLTAAIQEQQAIIEDLKTRIEILENK
jgi:hypothetical protein